MPLALGSTSSTSVPSPGADRTSAVPPSRVSRPRHRVTQAAPVVGHRLRIEPLAAVAHEHRHALGRDLGVEVGRGRPRVLGGVDQRLAGGGTERGELLVDRGVADDDRVDDQRVVGLDLGHHARDEPGPGAALAHDLRVVEPGPQLALLAAGQPVDRLLVVGVPLDEREGLQHRVVQVRGHAGPLLRADARGALLGARVQQPAPDRRGHQDDADEDHQGRGEPVARVGQLAGGGEQQHDAAGGQHDAAGQRPAHPGDGEGAVGVELPPDHGQTRGDQDQRQDERAAGLQHLADRGRRGEPEDDQDDQLTAAGPGAQLHRSGRRLLAGGGDRHGQPEQAVDDDADARSWPGRRRPPGRSAGPAAGAPRCRSRPRPAAVPTGGARAGAARRSRGAAPRSQWWSRSQIVAPRRPGPTPVITPVEEPGSDGGLP